MNYKPILIVGGEPNSVFLEIFFKIFKLKKINSPIILIASEKILKKQMEKLNFKRKINLLKPNDILNKKINNSSINLINVNFDQKNAFEKISKKSNKFIEESFNVAFEIIKKKKIKKFINGPISKKTFLSKKYLGITEYISNKFSSDKNCMLIYNKNLSVCPITTHLPLKQVAKNINKKIIKQKITLINNFYMKNFGYKPKIAVLGLNPHCESVHKFNEDAKIILPVIKNLKKKIPNIWAFSSRHYFYKKYQKKI